MDAGTAPLVEVYPSGYPAAVVAGRSVSLRIFIPASAEADVKIEPLHRHRVRVMTPKGRKPFPQMYPDPRSDKWEEYVAGVVRQQALATETEFVVPGTEDFTLPLTAMRVFLTLRFNLPKPKSYPARIEHHTKKPDIDNYGKAVIDGLVKGQILEDDGMITDLTVQKRYLEPGHPEGVEVDLTALPCEVI